jgi:hypothetical protein
MICKLGRADGLRSSMRGLLPLVSLLVACRPSADDETMDDVVDDDTGTQDTDTETSSGTPNTETIAEQCASVCTGYAACGCADRCQTWCDSYLDWRICVVEIDALIACGATHPSPCTWGEELQPDITCMSEIQAFSSCSGNSFFPLPGVPEVCEQG